jgi:glyoxylase-like metal-dependent hydrolase (beta-lactamase superfamily II)
MPVTRNAGLLLSLLWLLPLSAFAQEGPVRGVPGAVTFPLGALQFTSLRDSGYVVSASSGDFGAAVGPSAVEKLLADAHQSTSQVRLDVDALLVKMPGHLILLDTGQGPKVPGALPKSLELAGVAPAAITDVLITHAHDDHVGGLITTANKPAFPNAKIRLSSREWTFLQSQFPSASKLIAFQVVPFEPGMEILPGITSIALYGHTPGHVAYEITSGNQKIEDVGDTVHSSIISMEEPQWLGNMDGDAKTAATVRTKEVARLAKAHELVFAPHFPFPGVGWIVPKGDGYVWAPDTEIGR